MGADRNPLTHPDPQARRFGEWPITLVLGGIVAGLAVAARYHFRPGTVIIAVAVLLAAGLRITLSPRQAGLLAVRGRAFDVLVLGGLGLGMLVLALAVPGRT